MLILFISYFSLRHFFISFPPCGMEKNSLSKQAYVAWNDMWFPHVLDQQVSRVFIYLCFAPAFRVYTKWNWRKALANCCLFGVLAFFVCKICFIVIALGNTFGKAFAKWKWLSWVFLLMLMQPRWIFSLKNMLCVSLFVKFLWSFN